MAIFRSLLRPCTAINLDTVKGREKCNTRLTLKRLYAIHTQALFYTRGFICLAPLKPREFFWTDIILHYIILIQ